MSSCSSRGVFNIFSCRLNIYPVHQISSRFIWTTIALTLSTKHQRLTDSDHKVCAPTKKGIWQNIEHLSEIKKNSDVIFRNILNDFMFCMSSAVFKSTRQIYTVTGSARRRRRVVSAQYTRPPAVVAPDPAPDTFQ